MSKLTSVQFNNITANLTWPHINAWLSSKGVNITTLVLSGLSSLSGTALDSTLPNTYPNLTRLVLSSNNMTGSIPANWEWFKLGTFNQLSLAGNLLNASLPSWLHTIMAPRALLDLSNNSFAGEVGVPQM